VLLHPEPDGVRCGEASGLMCTFLICDDIEKEGKELQIAKETQKLNWYVSFISTPRSSRYDQPLSLPIISDSCTSLPRLHPTSPHLRLTRYPHYRRKLNTSPATLDEKEVLKKFLTNPPVKKIDLHFPLGLEVTARNLKGVTIKDALDAIHKQFKKKVTFPPTQNPDTYLFHL